MTSRQPRRPSNAWEVIQSLPRRWRGPAVVLALLLALAGAATLRCEPEALQRLCEGVLGKPMERDPLPGQRTPPCPPCPMYTHAFNSGCWADLRGPDGKPLIAPDGGCGENRDDPEGTGRCFAPVLGKQRAPAAAQESTPDGSPLPAAWREP